MERPAGDDAVAPVIAIVMMVAITVIVASVVGAFALTLAESEQEEPVHAAVTVDVDQINDRIQIHVTSMGNAEYVLVRGPLAPELENSDYEPYLNNTGERMTLVYDENDSITHLRERGSLGVVAVQGTFQDQGYYPDPSNYPDAEHVPIAAIIPVEQQTQVRQVDYDFS